MDKEEITTEDTAPLLDRNLYRTIKKMDRGSLESLIQDIYEQGRQKGLSEAGVSEVNDEHNVLDLRVLETQIRTVSGMGEKCTEAVMLIIEQWMGV